MKFWGLITMFRRNNTKETISSFGKTTAIFLREINVVKQRVNFQVDQLISLGGGNLMFFLNGRKEAFLVGHSLEKKIYLSLERNPYFRTLMALTKVIRRSYCCCCSWKGCTISPGQNSHIFPMQFFDQPLQNCTCYPQSQDWKEQLKQRAIWKRIYWKIIIIHSTFGVLKGTISLLVRFIQCGGELFERESTEK